MRLPVQVAADGPGDVVEISEVISDVVQRRFHVVHVADHVMSGAAHLLDEAVHALHRTDHGAEVVAHGEHVGCPVFHELKVFPYRDRLRADLKRYRRVIDRPAQRAGDALHHRDPRCAKDLLGDSVQDDHVPGIAHVVIAFDHQDVGIHCGSAEVVLGGGVTDVGGQICGNVVAVVVAGFHARHDRDADQGQCQRGGEHRCGPAHRRGGDATPAAHFDSSFRIEQTEPARHGDDGRRRGQRPGDHNQQTQS